jgi:hypothetical protein
VDLVLPAPRPPKGDTMPLEAVAVELERVKPGFVVLPVATGVAATPAPTLTAPGGGACSVDLCPHVLQ